MEIVEILCTFIKNAAMSTFYISQADSHTSQLLSLKPRQIFVFIASLKLNV